MHVPPTDWTSDYKAEFKTIINQYAPIVIGMLVAHTHYDELHAIKSGNIIIPVIYSAGLSTARGNSSSFKTVSLTRQNAKTPWLIKDYTTYYFKGYTANVSSIKQYYDFNAALCDANIKSVAICLSSHIKAIGDNYKFDDKASELLGNHYYANPNVPGNKNASDWVTVYK